MSRTLSLLAGLLLAGLELAACGAVTPGGEYSGIPDTRMGNWRGDMESGSISTDGVIRSNRDGYLIRP